MIIYKTIGQVGRKKIVLIPNMLNHCKTTKYVRMFIHSIPLLENGGEGSYEKNYLKGQPIDKVDPRDHHYHNKQHFPVCQHFSSAP